jgi:hypothetical protein
MNLETSIINSVTYETILDLIEDSRKCSKESAIKMYRYLLTRPKSINFYIGGAIKRVLYNFGVKFQINVNKYYFNDEEKSWNIDFLTICI